MEHITALLMRAGRLVKKQDCALRAVGVIEYRPDKGAFALSGQIWGQGGTVRRVASEHSTRQEAAAAWESAAADYPEAERIGFILEDGTC
jgi:hypothetical protein